MAKFRLRVKKIRTKEVSVYVVSRAGKPDEIHLVAGKDTMIHMGIRGVKKQKEPPQVPLPTPEEMFEKILQMQTDWSKVEGLTK